MAKACDWPFEGDCPHKERCLSANRCLKNLTPRQGLWQNLRAALAYILLAWAIEVMPEPVSTMLARGIISVQEEIDAYEKANRGK